MITPDFKPNKLLAVNKANQSHNEIKTRLEIAKNSHSLHLSQLNLNVVLPAVFKMNNLVRLDLAFNNLVRLDPAIGDLQNLLILWLNDNPLREVPIELSKCLKLKEIDLKNTFVISLPREMANLTSLLMLNLDGCPTKESLSNTYASGMPSIHADLRRKEDRKHFKEHLFDHLTEWVYPSVPKDQIFEMIEQIFAMLKDCNSEMLKRLQRNSQMLFPVRFVDVDPLIIREKLFKLYDEGIARQDIAQLQLRLKSHYLDEPLESVVILATDIFKNIPDQATIDIFFKYKSNIFTAPFKELSSIRLLENLAAYRKRKQAERLNIIKNLKDRIENLYIDDKLKPEKLVEYTEKLTKALKYTSVIQAFTLVIPSFMPKYNELKNFSAQKIKEAYEAYLVEEEKTRMEEERHGPFKMTYDF